MSENIQFNAEIGRVLDIVINSLYTNKDAFLRELLSNSSDACEKLRYLSLSDQGILEEDPDIKITAILNDENKTITIRDSGIGMDREDLINSLGTIAKSGTKEFIQKLSHSENKEKTSDMIGQFGVGFYSAFMVANKVEVFTRKASSSKSYCWSSDGKNSYTINELADNLPRGTSVVVHLKENAYNYVDKFHVRHVIETYSGNVSVPLYLSDSKEESQINSKPALWMKNKKDVSSDEYEEFFRTVTHLPGKPWAVLHNKMEGKVDFNMLLGIPSTKPFDIFHPDRQTRVKLYVKKVFITEKDIDLVPKYMRFVYGVIDSPDLPLNISRETLQDSLLLNQIRDLVVKKILQELKSKMEDLEDYKKFWDIFGQLLKEGLCEMTADRDAIMNLCLFKTTKSGGEYVTIKEYIDRMQKEQDKIYYYVCDNYSDGINAPQLEIFKKKDIEVLILSDYVDSFWTTVITDHSGFDFKSAMRADTDVDNIKKDDEQTPHPENEVEIKDTFTKALEGVVKDVVISKKLTDSPACISLDSNSMDIRMEKLMIAQGQMKTRSLKTLEINTNHSMIKATFELLKNDITMQKGIDMALSIFEIASIAQDEPLKSPNDFAKRIWSLIHV